ncbi:hypothetical protein K474DRAFT_1670323 [Panus rudis PR-1116 ss-1]|nr:hypothetical protein K474DRAFT_1670323 [Panus rudis PR-1116 ss-1]
MRFFIALAALATAVAPTVLAMPFHDATATDSSMALRRVGAPRAVDIVGEHFAPMDDIPRHVNYKRAAPRQQMTELQRKAAIDGLTRDIARARQLLQDARRRYDRASQMVRQAQDPRVQMTPQQRQAALAVHQPEADFARQQVNEQTRVIEHFQQVLDSLR